jgi:hypothetical protein
MLVLTLHFLCNFITFTLITVLHACLILTQSYVKGSKFICPPLKTGLFKLRFQSEKEINYSCIFNLAKNCSQNLSAPCKCYQVPSSAARASRVDKSDEDSLLRVGNWKSIVGKEDWKSAFWYLV